jgi:hypothetical protein
VSRWKRGDPATSSRLGRAATGRLARAWAHREDRYDGDGQQGGQADGEASQEASDNDEGDRTT